MELLGPAPHDSSRQSRQNQGFSRGDFTIDFDERTAVCPAGRRSFEWWDQKHHRNNEPVVKVFFSAENCGPCPMQAQCTRPPTGRRGRGLTFLPRERHEALQAARNAQDTDGWKQRYATRAGVEGTISQASARPGYAAPAAATCPPPAWVMSSPPPRATSSASTGG
ncbi:transposase [Nonomuraea sp. NPDC049400]|uniref:transposase n=1 Tax=Nonomuraea sp. NPDC049400 TaxID=3364352 RepID=UPI0037B8639E